MAIARIEFFDPSLRVGCLRVWDSDTAEHGDSYQWACTVAEDPQLGKISLHGVDKPHTRDHHRAVVDLLTENQVRFLEYERRTTREIRRVIRDLHKRRPQ